MLKWRQQVFRSLAKTEAKEILFNGIKFTLNGCVYADRPKVAAIFRQEVQYFCSPSVLERSKEI